MPCNLIGQELQFGFGFQDQADIDTINGGSEFLWLETVSREPGSLQYQNSSNAAMTGKGHEFPTIAYKEAKTFDHTYEFLTSAELLAWLSVYGMGKFTKSGAGDPFTYDCLPAVRGVDSCELKYFSVVQKDQRASALLDQALRGCVVGGFTLRLQSGPERANSSVSVRVLGSGRETRPSAVSLGSVVTPSDLLAASMTLTANGTDYVTSRRINSCEFSWDNAPIVVYAPGGGVENGYGVASKIEMGQSRGYRFRANVDFQDMTELDKIRDLTTGTGTLVLTNSASRKWTAVMQRLRWAAAAFGENERGITLDIEGEGMYHSSNGLLDIEAICGIDNIGA